MRTPFARFIAPVLALAAISAGSLQAQTPPPATARSLSLATLAPAGSTWMRVLDSANRELRQRTANALSLRIYPGGVQGDESEVIRKIRTGRLDGALVTGIGLGQVHRPVLAFQLPGMFQTAANMERSRAALATEVETNFRTAGFELMAWGESGSPRMFSQTPVHAPADLRSLHPWIWTDDVILPALYGEVGATGVRLSVPEVLGALQTHRVNAVVAPPTACLALQWSSQVQYVSDASNSFGLGGMLVSRRAFESLPEDQRTTLRAVMNQYNQLLGRNLARQDAQAMTAMTGRGVTLVPVGPAERQQWVDLFNRTRARLVGTVSDAAWMTRVRTAGQ